MSTSLGPIHFWLYRKICFQEALTAKIADMAINKHLTDILSYEIEEKYIKRDLPSLENVIDTDNIHGWLQERINDAEIRYSKLIDMLLINGSENQDRILQTAYEFGLDHKVGVNNIASGIYKIFEDSFVNGMPCDKVNTIIAEEDDFLIWVQAMDIHGQYWTDTSCGAGLYYLLRESVMKGMLEGSGYSLETLSDDSWKIVKQ